MYRYFWLNFGMRPFFFNFMQKPPNFHRVRTLKSLQTLHKSIQYSLEKGLATSKVGTPLFLGYFLLKATWKKNWTRRVLISATASPLNNGKFRGKIQETVTASTHLQWADPIASKSLINFGYYEHFSTSRILCIFLFVLSGTKRISIPLKP